MPWIPRKPVGGALLVALGVAGLFVSGRAGDSGWYVGGLALFAVCTLGVFALISASWGRSPIRHVNVLPANGAARWAVAGLAAVAGIFGLFQAHGNAGGFGYANGLALFAVAVAYDFLLLKDWFDRNDAGRRGQPQS